LLILIKYYHIKFDMSNKKTTKKAQWGGRRKGSGAKPRVGGTAKICVSVTKEVWHDALNNWHDTGSQLVDHLLRGFVANKVSP
jgi:hypothetical protein